MATCGLKIQRPRQVIVVVLLTSVFWFLFNTFILFTYQGYRPAPGTAREFRRTIRRGEDDELLNEFEKASEHRGSSNLRFHTRDEANIKGNIAGRGGQNERPKLGVDITGEMFGPNAGRGSDKRRLPSVVLNTKPTSGQQQTAPGKILDVSRHMKTTKSLHKSADVGPDPNGPGERGRAVTIGEDEKAAEQEGYSKHAFNELASKKISLHRSIPDTRNSG